jgi:hypothetical protein
VPYITNNDVSALYFPRLHNTLSASERPGKLEPFLTLARYQSTYLVLSKAVATKALNVEDTTAASNGQAYEEAVVHLEARRVADNCIVPQRNRLRLVFAECLAYRFPRNAKAIGVSTHFHLQWGRKAPQVFDLI